LLHRGQTQFGLAAIANARSAAGGLTSQEAGERLLRRRRQRGAIIGDPRIEQAGIDQGDGELDLIDLERQQAAAGLGAGAPRRGVAGTGLAPRRLNLVANVGAVLVFAALRRIELFGEALQSSTAFTMLNPARGRGEVGEAEVR